MGREGEAPAQIFWHIGIQKKWYKLSKLGGGWGGRGNLDKIQKKSYFFRETFPNKRSSALFPPWTASIVNAMIAGQFNESFLPRHRWANHKANQAK